MDVINRLDEARLQTNVLEHPFYERWSAGKLSSGELAVYAGQYRHAVDALARTSALTARSAGPEHRAALERHAEEETAHVELWDRFVQATAHASEPSSSPAQTTSPPPPAPAITQTAECAAAWTAGEDVLDHLAVLYAIEASQPEISRTKLDGLIEHYGYTPDAPAIEYFRLHERLDVEHSRQAGELIEELLAECPDAEDRAQRMVEGAHAALRGNWELLSGVESISREQGLVAAS
jgi:pyrroloquinoline-quinone synthase